MNRLVKFTVLVCLLLTAAGTPLSLAAQEKHFPVVVAAWSGYNIGTFAKSEFYFEMTNLATGAIYRSRGYNKYSIIEDIPQGAYVVSYVECGLLGIRDDSQALVDFFGVIEIDSDAIWYLGHFKAKRKYGGGQKWIEIKNTGRDISKRVLRYLRQLGYGRQGLVYYQTADTSFTTTYDWFLFDGNGFFDNDDFSLLSR